MSQFVNIGRGNFVNLSAIQLIKVDDGAAQIKLNNGASIDIKKEDFALIVGHFDGIATQKAEPVVVEPVEPATETEPASTP